MRCFASVSEACAFSKDALARSESVSEVSVKIVGNRNAFEGVLLLLMCVETVCVREQCVREQCMRVRGYAL